MKSFAETMTYPPVFFPSELHFENFVKAWKSGPFLKYFLNSCIVTIVVIVMQFLVTIPAAYAYARCRFRGKNIMFGITLATLMIPTQLIFVPMFLLFSKMKLINSYLSLILPFCASGFGIFMVRQRFMQIPEELIEAARAGQCQRTENSDACHDSNGQTDHHNYVAFDVYQPVERLFLADGYDNERLCPNTVCRRRDASGNRSSRILEYLDGGKCHSGFADFDSVHFCAETNHSGVCLQR